MKRVWDYIGLAVAFAGLGYLVLWLLDWSGLPVSPILRAAGGAAAAFAVVSLPLRIIGRRRRAATGYASIPRKGAAILRPARRKRALPLPKVKPRDHFGLRGKPH